MGMYGIFREQAQCEHIGLSRRDGSGEYLLATWYFTRSDAQSVYFIPDVYLRRLDFEGL